MVASINEKETASSSENEKKLSVEGQHAAPVVNEQELDAAYHYMNQHDGEVDDTASVDLAALRRKIDWRIVPIMFAAYTMQFIDKVMINVSREDPRKVGTPD